MLRGAATWVARRLQGWYGGGLGCVLGYLQSGVKLRTQKGGHAKKEKEKKGRKLLPITRSVAKTGSVREGAR